MAMSTRRLTSVGLALATSLALVATGPAPQPAPPEPIVESTPPTLALGPASGAHRLVIYSDYECAVCALLEREAGAALRVMARGGRLRLEIRHAPLAAHRRAPRAASAAVCAQREARGWAMHEALFATTPRWRSGPPAAPWFLRLADSLGLDRRSFAECLGDPAVAAAVATDRDLAAALGVAVVPTIFLDRERLDFRTPRALVRRVRRAIG
jgi:protein-disulfide isomerase